METRRLLLAIVLSLAVLLAWNYFFAPEPPPRDVPPVADGVRPVPERPPEGAAPEGEPGVEAEPGRAEAGAPPEAEWTTETAERRVVIENDRVRATFTSRGAQLVSFELKEHRREGNGQVDLVRQRAQGPWPFGLLEDGEPHPLNDVLFATETDPGDGGGAGVAFRYAGPQGVAEKSFRFRADGLLEVAMSVPGQDDWGFLLGPGLRNPATSELGGSQDVRSLVYRLGDDVERVKPAKVETTQILPAAGLVWAGLDDNYFLTAMIFDPARPGVARLRVIPLLLTPGAEGEAGAFRPLPAEELLTDEEEDLPRELELVIEPGEEEVAALAYWGAKQYEQLQEMPGGLERAVDLGFFRPLAVPLLVALHWIYENVVRNYGWAIVLLTFLIKLVLLPLTHKSYVSMRKMQELQPKLKALQAKYRPKLKDKQGRPNMEMQRKMNEEMMALYKEHGVNPAGGCLPMLLQIPVFFGFYKILLTAVELRDAPWMLWIKDLSIKDPFYVLPVVMAGTQYIQQRMTPSSADPMQRRIFQLMPLFLLFLFLQFPAGLVLYWLTNNVLTIAQQWIYNHLKQRRENAATPPEGKKAKSAEGRARAK